MTKMTDYDDNLFIINERVKLLEKGAVLDIDPDLFSIQFNRDLEFIYESLQQIRNQLDSSAHTLQKPENMRNLMMANQRAGKLIHLLSEKGYLQEGEESRLTDFFSREADTLEEILLKDSSTPGNAEQVSKEEFEFLLKDNQDS